jgi:acyl dehydratase
MPPALPHESDETVLEGRPPKLASYLRAALRARPGSRTGDTLPRVRVVHRGVPIDPRHLAAVRRVCGADPAEGVPFDYPLWLLFHYHLGIFGHARFPWPLTRLLAMHTSAVRRRPIVPDAPLDLEVRTAGQRRLAKGIEFDFHTVIAQRGAPVWESASAYYLRGPGGGTDTRPVDARLVPLPAVEFESRWQAPRGIGWRVARLSGDYNPMHYAPGYARRFGYARAFAHTQPVVAMCLRRLPRPLAELARAPLRLDVAYKGPVYYGSRLVLRGAAVDEGYRFDLYCDDADKPAIPGLLERASADAPLEVA